MAYDDFLKASTTSKIIEIGLRNSTTGQGATGYLAAWIGSSYVREGGTRTAVSMVAGTAGDTYSAGKWCEIDSTNMPGLYSFHIPNLAISGGTAGVNFCFLATGVINKYVNIRLVTPDSQNSGSFGLTSLPNGTFGANNNSISSGVLSTLVESSYTLKDIMRLGAALLVGKRSGGGTTGILFTGLDGATTRVTFSVDGSGNSLTVPTLNPA